MESRRVDEVAGPVRTEENGDPPLRRHEVEIAERGHVTEGLAHGTQRDSGRERHGGGHRDTIGRSRSG